MLVSKIMEGIEIAIIKAFNEEILNGISHVTTNALPYTILHNFLFCGKTTNKVINNGMIDDPVKITMSGIIECAKQDSGFKMRKLRIMKKQVLSLTYFMTFMEAQ
jgi:hypothetical protein